MPDEPLIVQVIHRYHPSWKPPRDNGREWVSCHCPFHGDSTKSGSVSFENDAFKCFACEVKGDVIAIIRSQEEVTFEQAKRIAASGVVGVSEKLRSKPAGNTRRRVFGSAGDNPAGDNPVRSRVRGRPTPWS